jgi:hypothetical protein
MKRILLASTLLGAISISSGASGATLGDAFRLSEDAEAAIKRVCPPKKPDELLGANTLCTFEFGAVQIGLVRLIGDVSLKAMEACLNDVRRGVAPDQCSASDTKYRTFPLPAPYEEMYWKVRGAYDSALKKYER